MTDQTLRQRPGDQALPVPNTHRDIQSQVIEDLAKRREVGIERYGTALQPFNGRDALRDLYEELLDAACYVRQRLTEMDMEPVARLVEALRLTAEYADLPPVEGWSWWDAISAVAPDVAEQYREQYRRLHPERPRP